MAPTTGDGMTPKAVVPLAAMIGIGIEAAGWPAAGICSADGPTAKVTTGPALCEAGRDGMIVAPNSPEAGLSTGVASMLTPVLEEVGLRTKPATVVAGRTEASFTPASSVAEVAELPAFSVAVMT